MSLFLYFLLLKLWSIGHPWNVLFHFSFLILRQSVGHLGRGISPSQGRYLCRTTQTQNKRKHTSVPWVGFEPTIPVFERAKIVHALDRAATVIGYRGSITWIFKRRKTIFGECYIFCSSKRKPLLLIFFLNEVNLSFRAQIPSSILGL
jgi:hypothetical protein